MDKNKKKAEDNLSHLEQGLSVSSMSECTGAIPAAPASESEGEEVRRLYRLIAGPEEPEE